MFDRLGTRISVLVEDGPLGALRGRVPDTPNLGIGMLSAETNIPRKSSSVRLHPTSFGSASGSTPRFVWCDLVGSLFSGSSLCSRPLPSTSSIVLHPESCTAPFRATYGFCVLLFRSAAERAVQ